MTIFRFALVVVSVSSVVIAAQLYARYHSHLETGVIHPMSKKATVQVLGLLYILGVAIAAASVASDVEDARRFGCIVLAVVSSAAAIAICTPVRWWKHG